MIGRNRRFECCEDIDLAIRCDLENRPAAIADIEVIVLVKRQAGRNSHAFDEYRAETLRRLEDEQKDFSSFLERLRFAKDKAEFDQFMAERRSRANPSPPPQS